MRKIIFENIKIALSSIRTNKLRSILTIVIIGIGISALVGMITAVKAIESSISDQFNNMGANSFNIQNKNTQLTIGNEPKQKLKHSYISYNEASSFKKKYNFKNSTVCISTNATGSATVKYLSEQSNPNISVKGIDENYLKVFGYDIKEGRNFNSNEIKRGLNIALIGSDLSKRLFKQESPIGKRVNLNNGKYTIIGLINSKGSSFGGSNDNFILLPITNARQYYSRENMAFNIDIMAGNRESLDPAIGKATEVFRLVRALKVSDENDFEINKNDSFAKLLIENLRTVSIVTNCIGLITLLGAAIALMNIMLVAVTERTREIGIRKAIGANNKSIRNQFLIEAIAISLIGGIVGVFFGILIGNIISLIMSTSFVIPWTWIVASFLICSLVGLLSGLMPAIKASKLDPIESLRFE